MQGIGRSSLVSTNQSPADTLIYAGYILLCGAARQCLHPDLNALVYHQQLSRLQSSCFVIRFACQEQQQTLIDT